MVLFEDGRLVRYAGRGGEPAPLGEARFPGARFLVEAGGQIVVGGERLEVVDPATGKSREAGGGQDLRLVASSGGRLVAVTEGSALVRIDLAGGKRETLFADPALADLRAIASLEGRLFGVSRSGVLLEIELTGPPLRPLLGPTTGLRYCELLAGRAGRLYMITHWGNLYRFDLEKPSAEIISPDWINARWLR